ncbi:hypothetical protein IRJ41_014344, partial [Triplophysa rosa]
MWVRADGMTHQRLPDSSLKFCDPTARNLINKTCVIEIPANYLPGRNVPRLRYCRKSQSSGLEWKSLKASSRVERRASRLTASQLNAAFSKFCDKLLRMKLACRDKGSVHRGSFKCRRQHKSFVIGFVMFAYFTLETWETLEKESRDSSGLKNVTSHTEHVCCEPIKPNMDKQHVCVASSPNEVELYLEASSGEMKPHASSRPPPLAACEGFAAEAAVASRRRQHGSLIKVQIEKTVKFKRLRAEKTHAHILNPCLNPSCVFRPQKSFISQKRNCQKGDLPTRHLGAQHEYQGETSRVKWKFYFCKSERMLQVVWWLKLGSDNPKVLRVNPAAAFSSSLISTELLRQTLNLSFQLSRVNNNMYVIRYFSSATGELNFCCGADV